LYVDFLIPRVKRPIYNKTKPTAIRINVEPIKLKLKNSGKMLNISVVYQLMKKTGIKNQKYLILENIRSVYNVGAIFRTADAIGIDKINLIGCTPTPIDRFGRERQDLHKAALGAEKNVSWEYFENSNEIITVLKEKDFKVISLEQSDKSKDYKNISQEIKDKNVAIVLGNEVDGVSKEVLEKSDLIMEIPMKGEKESLNVSVATGIVLYRLFD